MTIDELMNQIVFDGAGLVPAVIQDSSTGRVLMLGYMNREAVELTWKEKRTTFFSRSRQELWRKGDTSGHIQSVQRIEYDCDSDALLVQVDQVGAACHNGTRSCFDTGMVSEDE